MTDLTDRMRTCAAAIEAMDSNPEWTLRLSHDAADLLREAADALEPVSDPLSEPLPVPDLGPAVDLTTFTAAVPPKPSAIWTTGLDTLPPPVAAPPSYRHPRVCPQCDSRATKRVVRDGNRVILSCPVCGTAWEYKP